jgi:hypothetical protein
MGIFLGLTMAFDVINHTLPLAKLEQYGGKNTLMDEFISYGNNSIFGNRATR